MDPRVAVRAYTGKVSGQRASVSACLLALAVQTLRKSNPGLLDIYLPCFVDGRTGRLYVLRSEPPVSAGSGGLLAKFPNFFQTIRANYDLAERTNATHTMLTGVDPQLNPSPALFRKRDVEWARVRLGWPEAKLSKRLVDMHMVRAPPDVRAAGIDCSVTISSEDFRKTALAMRPTAGCFECGKDGPLHACAGCGKARYCSRSCQRMHWRSHKQFCALLLHIDFYKSARSLAEDMADV